MDWPYGRRDSITCPTRSPKSTGSRSTTGGCVPGRAELSDEGGVNAGGNHAISEGTAHNGVRTAVEDFLAETDLRLRFESVCGFHGLGILVSQSQLAIIPKLVARLGELSSAEWLVEQCRELESPGCGHRLRRTRSSEGFARSHGRCA